MKTTPAAANFAWGATRLVKEKMFRFYQEKYMIFPRQDFL